MNWHRKYWIAIPIIVVVSLVATIQMLKASNCVATWTFDFLNDWAMVLSAAATVTLAIVAFWTIRKSSEQSRAAIEENRRLRAQDVELDFKRRTLEDIVNWVMDINKYCLPPPKTGKKRYMEWIRGISVSLGGEGKWVIGNSYIFGSEFKTKLDDLLAAILDLNDKIREVEKSGEYSVEEAAEQLSKFFIVVLNRTDSVLLAALKIKSDEKL